MLSLAVYSISFTFRYEYNDPELMEIIRIEDELFEVFSGYGPLEDMVPGMVYVWESGKMKTIKRLCDLMDKKILMKKFKEHVESFDKGICNVLIISFINTRAQLFKEMLA